MLAGGGIAPMARSTSPGGGSMQAHVEAAPRGVVDIADEPVTTGPTPAGQVMAADRLGLARELVRQFGRGVGHGILQGKGPPRGEAGPGCWSGEWLLGGDREGFEGHLVIFGRALGIDHGRFAVDHRRLFAGRIGDGHRVRRDRRIGR